jgi:alanyl-tRNA synthetase
MRNPLTSAAIRQRFTEYYAAHAYRVLPRAPMMDPSIPMSFVMSAGLVQIETSLARTADRPGNKFVLVQDCFRHFDLDKVGNDGTHLSLFEMPGAFVFGPNGKADTIQRMWTLATTILGMDPDRIWASYFKGGAVLQNLLPEDTATRQAWRAAGLPERRMVGLGAATNYWVQGQSLDGLTAPRKCGPNTELFFDRGADQACGPACQPGCPCDRFVEFSNSLFIGYELAPSSGELHPLAEPFTETVIGTERVAMILQGVSSVFEIEGFQPLVEAIHPFIRQTDLPEAARLSSARVIADYLRALYCLVADGAPPPGKNGRERIIKLLIRGVLTHQILLGIESPRFLPALLNRVAPTLAGSPEAPATRQRLMSYFEDEARRFSKTVERSRRQLLRFLQENGGERLSEAQAVALEKKWGLPRTLAARMVREKQLEARPPRHSAQRETLGAAPSEAAPA